MVTAPTKTTYRDIDFTFSRNPVTNDVSSVTDAQAILQHVRLLLSTEAFDVQFHPEIACGLPWMEFELFTQQVVLVAQFAIQSILQALEPRAVLVSLVVDLEPDESAFNVSGQLQIVSTGQLVPFQNILQRYR